MFSDNERISLRQLKRLLVFDLFSISALIIPWIATTASSRDGIIAILLSTLFALIYAFILLRLSKEISGNMLEFSKNNLGRIVTFIIGLLFVVKMIACCVFVARLFGEVINETLLEDTDYRIIILLLLIVSAYATSKGFEVRARIAEILFFIVIVPIFIFLILGLKNVDLANLMPLKTESLGSILKGGYKVFLTLSMLELLLFSAPLISYSNTDMKKKNSLFNSVSQALLIVCIINILFFLVTVGILGVEETKYKLWSTVSIFQVVKMPGGFIQRQDSLILGIWMLSIFTIISGFFYYIRLVTKQIWHVPSTNYLLVFFVILLFGASAIPVKLEEYYYYFEKYMMYIGIPQSVVLPVIIVLFGKCNKIRKNHAVVKSIVILLTLASTVTLTGCRDMTEIEDRNFIQSMGVDLVNDEFTIYYELPDLKALTGQGSADTEKLMVKLKGNDFWQIEDQYALQSNKKLDFSHLKAIVLGKNMAENTKKMEEFLSYVENKYDIGRNTLIFVSETDAKEVYTVSENLSEGIGDYLDRLYRINLLNTGKEEVTVGDLIHSKNNTNLSVLVPILRLNGKTLETSGLSVFNKNHLASSLNEESAAYIDIANGFGKNSRLFLLEEQKKNQNSPDYVIKVISIARKIDVGWNNDKPYITMKINGTGVIEKGVENSEKADKASYNNRITKIEHLYNKQIKERITKSIEDITKGKKVDFLNLYRMTSYKNREIWLQYEELEELFIEDLSYSIEIDIKLK